MAKKRQVLPDTITPIHYVLQLEPDFTAFTFAGEVTISINVHEPTDSIRVNAVDLTMASIVVKQGEAQFPVNKMDIDEDEEELLIGLGKQLQKGEAMVKITFTGELGEKLNGFYRSSYEDNGKTKWLGTTQFESTYARHAFPCFDEPGKKATFGVTLIVDKELEALCNMPVETQVDHGDNKKKLTYADTPIMSTYLLCWVIGDLHCIEGTVKHTRSDQTVLVRVYGTGEKAKKQGQFALDVALRTLPFYEEYFGSDYPLPKADLVAIPDFDAGAMENWGLVTFRETTILCDSDSSAHTKQYVSLVVTHELAHQWFGNLVTMDWWQELWLNEGFACFTEYFATDKLFPEWNSWNDFTTGEYAAAMEKDALLSTHPIEVPVYRTNEIDEIFDDISYCKGACVIRMLQSLLGVNNFQAGVNDYLKTFEYKNAKTVDLWAYLTKHAKDVDVGKVMGNWTAQPGYPLLYVTKKDNETLSVRQSRFLSARSPSAEEDNVVWTVPVGLRKDGDTEVQQVLIKEKETTVTIPTGCKWVKFNADCVTMCRVHYDDALSHALAAALETLPTLDRIGVIADQVPLAKAGLQSTCKLFEMLAACSEEKEYFVWAAIAKAVSTVMRVFAEDKPLISKMEAFVAKIAEAKASELGWDVPESDDDIRKKFRVEMLGLMARARHQPTLDMANKKFQEWVETGKGVSADLRDMLYSTVVRYGGEKEWNQVREIYEKSDEVSEKDRALHALGRASDKTLLQKALEYSLSDKVKSQDSTSLGMAVARNTEGTAIAWEFVKTNWERIFSMYEGGFHTTIWSSAPQYFVDEAKAKEVNSWFEGLSEKHQSCIRRTVMNAMETIEDNAKWKVRDIGDLNACPQLN
eukprot:TRINITY_DN48791_c0_g1_i1.p1 TRINITY_DN48791_c0_g1~~TRINITY_DN48791_c0_g1_i1.p1  ORF type:complete len:863 (-),score=99.96 TRINITY_DN48791_c0_g1_i1:1104-3692(-)